MQELHHSTEIVWLAWGFANEVHVICVFLSASCADFGGVLDRAAISISRTSKGRHDAYTYR